MLDGCVVDQDDRHRVVAELDELAAVRDVDVVGRPVDRDPPEPPELLRSEFLEGFTARQIFGDAAPSVTKRWFETGSVEIALPSLAMTVPELPGAASVNSDVSNSFTGPVAPRRRVGMARRVGGDVAGATSLWCGFRIFRSRCWSIGALAVAFGRNLQIAPK